MYINNPKIVLHDKIYIQNKINLFKKNYSVINIYPFVNDHYTFEK